MTEFPASSDSADPDYGGRMCPGTARVAVALDVGDIIRAPDGEAAEVLHEPLSAHRGWSPLDEFEVLVLIELRKLAPGSEPMFVRWSADRPVEVLG